MGNKLGAILKYTLSFAIAGALLYFSFRNVDWDSFVNGLKQTRWVWVGLSCALGLLAFVLRGLRWNMLLKPLDKNISRMSSIAGACVANLVNCIIPYGGEIARSGLLSTPGAGFGKILGTVALERAWDIIFLGAVYFLVLFCDWGGAGSFFADAIWIPLKARFGGWVWAGVILLALLLAAGIRAVLAFRSTNRLCQRIYAFGAGVWNGFASFTRMKKKGWFLLYSIGIWVCYWFMCVMIAMAFPAVGHIGVMDALLIMAAGSLSSLVPAPGGFGTYHYFVTLTLSGLFGVPWDTGIIYATLSHESQALNMIITGSLGYLYLLLARKRPGRL